MGVSVAWWWTRGPEEAPRPSPAVTGAAPRAAAPANTSRSTGVTSAPPVTAIAAPAEAAPLDEAERLRQSSDYFEYASEKIAAARQGDAAAQFYLSSALGYCESLYDWYFIVYGPNGTPRHRTLDEAQALTAERQVFTPDDVRNIQQRCQKLRSIQPPPFGTSQEWLASALAADFPQAQVSSALNFALQGHERGDPGKSRAARDEARRLALDSLRTRDPDVMAMMGEVAANLAGDDAAAARKAKWTWPLAACLRQKHCESLSEWMRIYCNVDTQCQPFETPVDFIRRQAGNDFDEIERRAREINQKLDDGSIEEGDI